MTWPSQQSCLAGLAGWAASGAHCILAMLLDGTVDNGMFAWQSSDAVVCMPPNTRVCCCRYVACMNPTAGSFVVNPRLQRLFMTLAVEFPGQESLMKIYGTFVTGHLKKFSADVQVTSCLCFTSRIKLAQLNASCCSCFRHERQSTERFAASLLLVRLARQLLDRSCST